MEKQVAILYAVTGGTLTSVPVEKIQEYEKGLYSFLDSDPNGVSAMNTIRTTGALDSAAENCLKSALRDYTEQFLRVHG